METTTGKKKKKKVKQTHVVMMEKQSGVKVQVLAIRE
jgi:hypothetical protein